MHTRSNPYNDLDKEVGPGLTGPVGCVRLVITVFI